MRVKVFSLFLMLGIVSCAHPSPLLPGVSPARLSTVTATQQLLASLPPADNRIAVAVYSFSDQTGQHKPAELPQYSRAVTQGGLALLKQALVDAGRHGWFVILERGGLDHLLKEREIIRAMRAEYGVTGGKQAAALGPLLYAGLLLEGGIVAYESNVETGGIGARYLGIGGSTTYRRDMVTVALRAVSIANGEVLLSVLTSKTIYSSALQAGVFRYVSFDELLEAETGVTTNEPPQLAVRQAIELGVYALVMEGNSKQYWGFQDREAGAKALADYQQKFGRPALATISSPADRTGGASSKSNEGAAKVADLPKTVERVLPQAPEQTSESACKYSSLPSRPEEGYYLQIAALPSNDREAPDYLRQLMSTGLPLVLQQTSVQGSTYCRVLVGPYQNLGAAIQEKLRITEIAGACCQSHGEPFLRKVPSQR